MRDKYNQVEFVSMALSVNFHNLVLVSQNGIKSLKI